jgi:hypothetical protein
VYVKKGGGKKANSKKEGKKKERKKVKKAKKTHTHTKQSRNEKWVINIPHSFRFFYIFLGCCHQQQKDATRGSTNGEKREREFFKDSKIWCNRGERRWIRDSREKP